jgi:hypothetical protein
MFAACIAAKAGQDECQSNALSFDLISSHASLYKISSTPMSKTSVFLMTILLLVVAAGAEAQGHPRIITARIVAVFDDQVVVRMRAGNEERTLEVSPATLKVTFKHDGESTQGTFADLRERMLCNILLDTPDGINAMAFVVNGRKPDDSITEPAEASSSATSPVADH